MENAFIPEPRSHDNREAKFLDRTALAETKKIYDWTVEQLENERERLLQKAGIVSETASFTKDQTLEYIDAMIARVEKAQQYNSSITQEYIKGLRRMRTIIEVIEDQILLRAQQ